MPTPYAVDIKAQKYGVWAYVHVFLNNGKMVAFSIDVLENSTLQQLIDWTDMSAMTDFHGVTLFDGPYDSMYLEMWSSPPPAGYTYGESHLWTHPSKRN